MPSRRRVTGRRDAKSKGTDLSPEERAQVVPVRF